MQSYLLPCYFVLVFGTLLVIWVWFAGRRDWYTVFRDSAANNLYNDAMAWFCAAEEQLLRWREARPLLRVGQSAYARSLVQQMIAAYRIMLLINEELDTELLSELYLLLGDLPPTHDPPEVAKPLSGGLLLYLLTNESFKSMLFRGCIT